MLRGQSSHSSIPSYHASEWHEPVWLPAGISPDWYQMRLPGFPGNALYESM